MLDSCRIRWAAVVDVEAGHLLVRMAHLEYDGSVLSLGTAREERIPHRIEGATFLDAVAPGDLVAVHWGFACDQLTPRRPPARAVDDLAAGRDGTPAQGRLTVRCEPPHPRIRCDGWWHPRAESGRS